MRTSRGTEDVVGCSFVRHPIAECFIDCILQSLRTGCYGDDFRTKYLHSRNIQCLTSSIFFTHVDGALQAKKRRCSGGRNTVLPGTGFSDDSGFAQFLRQKSLAKHVVDLVRARMV